MQPQDILNLVDFSASRIILSATELKLFERLQTPRDPAELAGDLEVDAPALARLLDALAALEILEKSDGRYLLPEALQQALIPGPQSILPMLEHRAVLWGKWGRLTEVVRRGYPETDRYENDERPQEEVESFIGAMAVVGSPSAKETAAALDLSSCQYLLDIGGGPAVYAMEFLSANPQLRVVQLDLPRVCEIARRNTADSAEGDRLTFVEGEALAVENAAVLAPTVGEGYDVVFMSNLIHSMSESEVMQLFARCAHWIKPGGRVVVKDFLLDDSGTKPARGAIFSINMLVATLGGRSYRTSEVSSWLKDALAGSGRVAIEQIELPDGTSSMTVAMPA